MNIVQTPRTRRAVIGAGAVAGAIALSLGGGTAAFAATAPVGHSDIVEVVCDANGDFELTSDIVGTDAPSGTGAGQLGTYTFDYDASAQIPYVSYSGGDWVIAGGTSGSEAVIADLGFHYEFDDADICPETITIGISVQSGSAVTFNGSTSVVLTQTAPHVHGTWRIDDPDNNSATSTSSVVHFPVSGSGVGSIGTVWPATINVGP